MQLPVARCRRTELGSELQREFLSLGPVLGGGSVSSAVGVRSEVAEDHVVERDAEVEPAALVEVDQFVDACTAARPLARR